MEELSWQSAMELGCQLQVSLSQICGGLEIGETAQDFSVQFMESEIVDEEVEEGVLSVGLHVVDSFGCYGLVILDEGEPTFLVESLPVGEDQYNDEQWLNNVFSPLFSRTLDVMAHFGVTRCILRSSGISDPIQRLLLDTYGFVPFRLSDVNRFKIPLNRSFAWERPLPMDERIHYDRGFEQWLTRLLWEGVFPGESAPEDSYLRIKNRSVSLREADVFHEDCHVEIDFKIPDIGFSVNVNVFEQGGRNFVILESLTVDESHNNAESLEELVVPRMRRLLDVLRGLGVEEAIWVSPRNKKWRALTVLADLEEVNLERIRDKDLNWLYHYDPEDWIGFSGWI